MYDTWIDDREESYLIISVCYWTRDSSHDEMIRSWWWDHEINSGFDTLYSRVMMSSLSVTYAKEYSYGSSHLSTRNWLVVIPFHIPHVISHVDAVL